MKYLFLILLAISIQTNAQTFHDVYLKVGAGYKYHEPDSAKIDDIDVHLDYGNALSARIELTFEVDKKWSFGIAHHSQWFDGWPVNDKYEYFKTEVFIDYKFSLGQ